MITCELAPLPKTENEAIWNWFRLDPCHRFIVSIQAELEALKVQLANAKLESSEFPNREIDATNALEKAKEIRAFLRFFEEQRARTTFNTAIVKS